MCHPKNWENSSHSSCVAKAMFSMFCARERPTENGLEVMSSLSSHGGHRASNETPSFEALEDDFAVVWTSEWLILPGYWNWKFDKERQNKKQKKALKKQLPGFFFWKKAIFGVLSYEINNIHIIYTYIHIYINYLFKHKTLKLSIPLWGLDPWGFKASQSRNHCTQAHLTTDHSTDVTSWQTPWIKDQVDHI